MTGPRKYRIAIVGATGAVGRAMIDVLEARRFPVADCVPFASLRSEGKKIALQGREYACQALRDGCFDGVDVVFLDAADEVSRVWSPKAVAAGCLVIDNSGVFRLSPEVPLVVPEINGAFARDCVAKARARDPRAGVLLAGPNCTTAQLVMALKPLHDRYGLERVTVSTYQSVSGAGTAAIGELRAQTGAALDEKAERVPPKHLRHPIAFNCIPHIGSFDAEGHTSEETKVIHETRKILGLPALRVSCAAVRVPTLNGHAESVWAEFAREPDAVGAREELKRFPGIQLRDDPSSAVYPLQIEADRRDAVFVGRIRKDPATPHGLQFWVVSDNLRKGAALNAVQIAETILG